MNIRTMMFATMLAVSGLAQGADASNFAKLKVTGKLLGAGFVAGGATVMMDKLSPNLTKGGIAVILAASTLAAARLICRADINTADKAIAFPLVNQYWTEANWFNAIVFGVGLASYGLYKNSGPLATKLQALLDAAASVTN